MMNPNGKKLVLWFLSLILCITACAPAFASTGDRVLVHRSNTDESIYFYIESVFPNGNGLYVMVQEGNEHKILRYADVNAEPEAFTLDERLLNGGGEDEDEEDDAEAENDADDEEYNENEGGEENSYSYVNRWFCYKNELYALLDRNTYDGESSKTEAIVQHAKLENGQVTLEESGLPELDLSCLIVDQDDYQYMKGIDKILEYDNKLVMAVYGDGAEVLEVLDMEDGTYTEIELGEDFGGEIAAGPEGSLLVTHTEWDDATSTNTVHINRLDLESRSEEQLMEVSGLTDGRVAPCYDPEKDTLYYVCNGELWAVPQFDAERIESVNDCQGTGEKMFMLPGGFVLVQSYNSVEVKNTDPAQRGSIRLRIRDWGWSDALGEAIYDMNNTRGDISVIRQQDWNSENDILQAMMNRDGTIDIYVMQYDGNEYSALRNREYLTDLSGNEKIAANVDRLYPYVRDAVMQNGKILGIPVGFTGETLGIDMNIWKEIGGTEEELPKTWNQFFDWVATIPERVDGRDVSLVETYDDRVYVRAQILQVMLNQYEAWNEKKGENSYAFASPMMIDLVSRLNNMDYDALEISEHQDEEDMDEEDGYLYNEDEEYKRPLLQLYTSPVMNGDNYYEPLFLSFAEDEDPVIPVRICAAFVNPFSEHPQEAMEFLAVAMDKLEMYYSYDAYTDKTEPVRDPYYEKDREWNEEYIGKLKKKIEKADDEEEKESLEQELKSMEEYMQDQEKRAWSISAEQIGKYQQRCSWYRVKGYSFFNDLFGDGNDEEQYNDFYKMFYSNEGAKMDPAELLGKLDQKVQMIRMERNY